MKTRFAALFVCLISLLAFASQAGAEASKAEGFSRLPADSAVIVMPLDIELFELGAGGVAEPQAEWTAKAHENIVRAFHENPLTGVRFIEVPQDDLDLEALNRLHGAVGNAIVLHHTVPAYALPTKHGKLVWSLGDSFGTIKEKTGARYALFSFVRDSYATGGRVAVMVVGALLGVGLSGGVQTGYASLVDLQTGDIVWFNRLIRASGDLREYAPARETLKALLEGFPN